MSNPNRIPRPRHLFPEGAAWLINGQRGFLRVRWALREDQDWFPAWSIGAMAGVCGMMLAVLLFFMGEPNLVAATIPSMETVRTLPETVIQNLPSQPTVTPFLNSTFPIRELDRPQLTNSRLMRSQLPYLWDQNELAYLQSRPKRIEERFLKDSWTRTTPTLAFHESFRPYFLQGATIPVTPAYVTSSGQRTLFDGIQSSRSQGLLLEKHVLPTASVGQPYTYVIHLTNSTNDPIDQVYVYERLSAIHQVVEVSPPAAVQGDELVWSLGQLDARGRKALQVTLLPNSGQKIETQTTLKNSSKFGAMARVSEPVVAVPESVPTVPEPESLPAAPYPPVEPADIVLPVFEELPPQREPAPVPVTATPPVTPVTAPELKLAVTPINVVRKGETLTLTFTVTNIGTAAAEEISLYVNLSGEFKHKYGEHVKHQISRLEPGESRRALLQATAEAAGTGHLAASLQMQGTERKSEELTIRVEPEVLSLGQRVVPMPVVECQRPPTEETSEGQLASHPEAVVTLWRQFDASAFREQSLVE